MLIFRFILCTCLIAVTSLQAQLKPLEVAKVRMDSENEMILLGKINRANLTTDPIFNKWFEGEYNFYKLPNGWAEAMKGLGKEVSITLFMGTWCADTQMGLGGIFKVLDALQIPDERIEMFALSEYKDSPQRFEEGLDIYNVPTVIFSKNGKELNRMVEFPVESWHADTEKILKGLPYKHSYFE